MRTREGIRADFKGYLFESFTRERGMINVDKRSVCLSESRWFESYDDILCVES